MASFLSDLGQREAALAAAQDAVALRRTLAAARPDAFLPNLATSLMVFAGCLDAFERHDEALTASVTAIQTLSNPFTQLPRAFERLMTAIVGDYTSRCEKRGREPDGKLLAPIQLILGALQTNKKDTP